MNLKKTIFCVIIVLLILGGNGCTMNYYKKNETNVEKTVIAQMKNFLFEKYGKFDVEYVNYSEAGWNQDYDVLYLKTFVNDSYEEFTVERHKGDSGYTYEDNYYGILIKPLLAEKMEVIANQYLGECKVYAVPSQNYPNNFISVNQIDEMLAMNDLYTITFFVVVSEKSCDYNNFETTAANFVDCWENTNIPSLVRVVMISSDDYEQNEKLDADLLLNKQSIKEYYEIINGD